MASADETFFPIRRLHLVFAASAVALAAMTVWMLLADHARPWKTYQRTYRDQVEPWFRAARAVDAAQSQTTVAPPSSGTAKAFLRLPVVEAWGRTLTVEQIWLPELTIDYNFRQVPRLRPLHDLPSGNRQEGGGNADGARAATDADAADADAQETFAAPRSACAVQ